MKRKPEQESSDSLQPINKRILRTAGSKSQESSLADRAGQQQQLSTDTAAAGMHTRLGSRLPGRAVTRSKARGGDGFSSDSDLLSAVLQAPAADPTAPSKGDLTRKPAPLVPGLASIPTAMAASTRLSVAGGTIAGLPAPAAKPRHQRSNSAGQAPKGSLQAEAAVGNDLALLADTVTKGSAGQQQELPEVQLPASAAAGLHSRSARLAAATVGSDVASILSLGNGSLSRASAPARQHKRVTHRALGTSSSLPATAAAVIAGLAKPVPAAAESPGQLGAANGSAEGSDGGGSDPSRRVRFAAGPLNPERHPNSTDDGHPASEGALAVPVRRVPASYGMDLSKGNVLMLEQLLGAECSMSVTRLKRRVGLLPPIRPPRPMQTAPRTGQGARRNGFIPVRLCW